MPATIKVNNVHKNYPPQQAKSAMLRRLMGKPIASKESPFTALKGLDVVIPDGSFTTIFGPNGSGKSTLFRLIAGLESPNEGIITINGKPVTEARIGFVFQNYRDSMLTWRTAAGNVRLSLEARKVKKDEQDAIARKYLKRVNMAHIADKPFYSLSGGQAQLVSIARAFAYQPDILLMDEPFSALDFQTSMDMMQILASLWQETGITTLFISHDIDEAVFLADYVMVLTKSPGRLQKMVPIKLPRPRKLDLLTQKKFFDLRTKVLAEFNKGSQANRKKSRKK